MMFINYNNLLSIYVHFYTGSGSDDDFKIDEWPGIVVIIVGSLLIIGFLITLLVNAVVINVIGIYLLATLS